MFESDKAIKLIREVGSMGLLACVLYFTYIKIDAQHMYMTSEIEKVKVEGRDREEMLNRNASLAKDSLKTTLSHKVTNSEYMTVRDPDGKDVRLAVRK